MKITNNIPKVKLGIVAVSRDCFVKTLSESRREEVVKCLTEKGASIYNCKITAENEADIMNALADVKANGVNALVIFLGNFGPEGPETMLAQNLTVPSCSSLLPRKISKRWGRAGETLTAECSACHVRWN